MGGRAKTSLDEWNNFAAQNSNERRTPTRANFPAAGPGAKLGCSQRVGGGVGRRGVVHPARYGGFAERAHRIADPNNISSGTGVICAEAVGAKTSLSEMMAT